MDNTPKKYINIYFFKKRTTKKVNRDSRNYNTIK